MPVKKTKKRKRVKLGQNAHAILSHLPLVTQEEILNLATGSEDRRALTNVSGNGPISAVTMPETPIACAIGSNDEVTITGSGNGASLMVNEIEIDNFNVVAVREAGGVFHIN